MKIMQPSQLMHEAVLQVRLKYIAFLRLIVQLEFYGLLLGAALAWMAIVPKPYFSLIIAFLVLRLITAHINHRNVAAYHQVQDQYMLYPFV